MALIAPDDLFALGTRARAGGFAMAVHAIGDRANHEVLEVFARLRADEAAEAGVTAREAGAPAHAARLRHRVEHVQLLAPDDFGRLAQLGVIASMQPVHAPSDMPTAERLWGARCAGAYAWRTQLAAGAPVAFGSDAPVEGIDPFWGIHAAVTRRRAGGAPGVDGWYPEQRLTVEEALRGFTLGAAYAAGMEAEVGSLACGKLADLVVLDRDIFSVEPMAIRDTVVLGTMVGGRWRYRAPELAS
jgi:predicted amidohydrolase YtcJ